MANFNTRPAIDRFMEKVMPVPEAGCWLWIGAARPTGYGNFFLGNNVHMSAHRAALVLHGRDIPQGMSVLHKCDTPQCVNPDHLFVGTVQDNHDDMRAKGRGVYNPPSGEANGHSKLTTAVVRMIRSSDERTSPLAKRLGLAYQTVWQVRQRRSWKAVA